MIDNTKFCQFCGAEQNAVVIPAASIPVSAQISGPDTTADVSDVSSSSDTFAETSMGVTGGESASSGSATAVLAAEAAGFSTPIPNIIPTNNLDAPETAVRSVSIQAAPSTPVTSGLSQTEITIKDEEKRPPERKYSFGHIVMCLAAAAVMAVAAGVFAGLYFSVIFTK